MYDNKFLVAFEGIDGTGKTTHCDLLMETIESWGKKARYIKANIKTSEDYAIIMQMEESYTKQNLTLEKSLKATLVAYERAKYFYKSFQENDDTEILLIDKYKYVTPMYMDYRGIKRRNPEMMLSWLPDPDLIIFFELDPSEAVGRIQKRTRIDKHENTTCLEYLNNQQKKLFSAMENTLIINASDTIENNQNIIVSKITEKMKEMNLFLLH